MLTFGSLFAGIAGFDAGFEAAGLECLWQVEIESDCRSVLARHFPRVDRFEDVRGVGRHNLKPVDIVCGGFPCQDLSVAGKRKGLEGARSGLFYEMVRITDELRPMFLVWENVPGLLSSDGGRDFARVLMALDSIGYSGAWTGLDAQWFGVAQRRRRIFGVFARGDIGAARCAEILSLGSRLRRDTPSRGEKGKGVAGPIKASAPSRRNGGSSPTADEFVVAPILEVGARTNGDGTRDGDGIGTPRDPMYTLQAGKQHGVGVWPADVAPPLDTTWADRMPGSTNQEWLAQKGGRFVPDISHPLKAEGADAGEDGTGRGTPLVVACNNFGEREVSTSLTSSQQRIDPDTETFVVTAPLTGNPYGDHESRESLLVAFAQNSRDEVRLLNGDGQIAGALSAEPGMKQQSYVAFNWQGGGTQTTLGADEEKTGCLQVGQTPAIAFCERGRDAGRTLEIQEEFAYCLTNPASGGRTHSRQIAGQFGVRRLTPRECERLQGFPDDWTLYGADGQAISDSARYRMLGNAVADPCAKWIGRRVVAVMSAKTEAVA